LCIFEYKLNYQKVQSSNNLDGKYRITTHMIRWTARIWSIIVIGILILLILGEGINPTFTYEWFGLLFIPFGISIGMILAWWWEGLGGSIIMGSLLGFYVIHFASTNTFPRGFAWLLFSVPGILFLLCWYQSRKVKTIDS
jgi:hypothetical protein